MLLYFGFDPFAQPGPCINGLYNWYNAAEILPSSCSKVWTDNCLFLSLETPPPSIAHNSLYNAMMLQSQNVGARSTAMPVPSFNITEAQKNITGAEANFHFCCCVQASSQYHVFTFLSIKGNCLITITMTTTI